ncbi:MFS transporter [Cellulosimicrobium sp. Marseille-Q4280]|uniref:MFS transporter n=1 Tax=Cellulosimicrobium sp. Marseille-Q4280 TaxID=2937992 RepID=UPI00204098F6|nr:MFS transporter [Cellulosimicrobium sp. Marseille-Q4280]
MNNHGAPALGSSPATGTSSRERLLTPAFLRLTAADLAWFVAAGVTIHVLPLHVTGPARGGVADAGMAFGAFAVTALVLRPVAGRLGDTWGRRPLLVGGALLGVPLLVVMAHLSALVPIVLVRLAAGAAEAAFFVASFAMLVDLAPRSRRGEALSYNSLGLYLGLALGPPLGEVLVSAGGLVAGWYGAAASCAVAAVLSAGLPETLGPVAPGERAPLVHRAAIAPSLGFLTSVVAIGGFLAFAPLHAVDVGMASTSVVVAVYGAVVVVCRLALARAVDRFQPLALGTFALVVVALGTALCAAWSSPAGLLLGTAVLGVGVALSTPAFFAAVFARVPAAERGSAAGTATACIDLGLAGPLALGLVAESLGIPWAFAATCAVAVAGAAWTARLEQRRRFVAASQDAAS